MTTPLQQAMLVKIAEDLLTCVNGAVPSCADEAHTFADMIIENAQDKGVFTSLVNAGLAEHNGHKGRDGEVCLTAAGFAEYQRIKLMTNTATENTK